MPKNASKKAIGFTYELADCCISPMVWLIRHKGKKNVFSSAKKIRLLRFCCFIQNPCFTNSEGFGLLPGQRTRKAVNYHAKGLASARKLARERGGFIQNGSFTNGEGNLITKTKTFSEEREGKRKSGGGEPRCPERLVEG
jgi:hypothetical protein